MIRTSFSVILIQVYSFISLSRKRSIAQMQEHVHLQRGHFACLAHVVPDRSGAALALLAQLAAGTQPSR